MIPEAMFRQWRSLVQPLKTRLANSIASAVIQNVDDSKKIQILQLGVLDGEDVEDCERLQEFGFNSVPLVGAEAVVVFPNGDRGNPLVVAVGDRRHRPLGWADGEAGIYNAFDTMMRLKADGSAYIEASPVRLGSDAAADDAVKGTTYRAAEDVMLGLIATALTALGGEAAITAPTQGLCTTAGTGIGTFTAAAAAYLAIKVKVE